MGFEVDFHNSVVPVDSKDGSENWVVDWNTEPSEIEDEVRLYSVGTVSCSGSASDFEASSGKSWLVAD